jgi:hypothetical protein
MKCVFITVFNQEKYVDMLYLLLESIYLFGDLDDNTDILIYTSTSFKNLIEASAFYSPKLKFEVNDTKDSIDKACKARLDLFQLPSTSKYEKILYLDTDILIKRSLLNIFDVAEKDLLYVLQEGNITDLIHGMDIYGGKKLFKETVNNYVDKSAFTSGIMLFKNCTKIQELFYKINKHMTTNPHEFHTFDQPYIVYNAFKYDAFNNKMLSSMALNINNHILKTNIYESHEKEHADKHIIHFPGIPGKHIHKMVIMQDFLKGMKKNALIPKIDLISDANTAPLKNNRFPIIGVCVSYNYFDCLKFMLPVNYMHFDQIYLITQEDDLQTIQFCQQFNNVTVIYYPLTSGNQPFDKFGAINGGLNIVYQKHPHSWYLILDSDVLLPNNFIDILLQENLNEECIYGAHKTIVLNTSKLLDKTTALLDNTNLNFNDPLYIKESPSPDIVGSFQLFKKANIYYRFNLIHTNGFGDFYFGYDNFKLFCNLSNVVYFHCGATGKNWGGKTVEFIDNVGIKLNSIYFNCNLKCKNIYYDNFRKIVSFKNEIQAFTDTNIPPLKNAVVPLVGICVSYDYFDTLQFTLPVNYMHFDKIYLVTRENDLQTINFCKQFENVVVLFYDFFKNNRPFDKNGALQYAQRKVYEENPNSWYLLIDSDILLPNNFSDILLNENLNPECLYGAPRNIVTKSSELLDKNILYPRVLADDSYDILRWQGKPPIIIGYFQLYKKHVFYSDDEHFNAAYGDNIFCHNNFNLFASLKSCIVFHLGSISKNWNGKIESFIDDIKISLTDIYYTSNKHLSTFYYNKTKDIVKIKQSNLEEYKNIFDDVWTCSDEFRYDLAIFFKNKSELKIAEIGSHKGYTTRFLANKFSKVYAVDNSVNWTNHNKACNKDLTNIDYVMLDIYKDPWHKKLPTNIEVSFIDADHSYEGCRSDILNSIKQFNDLQYIVLDDYGVWSGVKKIVDELLQNGTFIFEKFIGLHNVPGPNDTLVKHVNEGIICRVNKEFPQLINKTFSWNNNETVTFTISAGFQFKFSHGSVCQYEYLSSQSINVKIGRHHCYILTFNDAFTEYTGVNSIDNIRVYGKYLNENPIIKEVSSMNIIPVNKKKELLIKIVHENTKQMSFSFNMLHQVQRIKQKVPLKKVPIKFGLVKTKI